MMDRQQQPSGALHPGIEPDRLQHHAGGRRKPAFARLRLALDAGQKVGLVEARNIDPPQAFARAHRTRRRNLQRPVLRLRRRHRHR
jgi:hypothetical protein